MEYNTARSQLLIAEYGRNVQKMIRFAVNIQDRDERNRAANTIVSVMSHASPAVNKDSTEFKHKIWNHLFVISNFELDVDSPFTKPTTESTKLKPETQKYNKSEIRYKHYGKNIQVMIQQAIEVEESEKKKALIKILANHMKKSYLTWNQGYVSDEIIADQLAEISKGHLQLDPNEKLTPTAELMNSNNTTNTSTSNNPKKKKPATSSGRNFGSNNNNGNNNGGGSNQRNFKPGGGGGGGSKNGGSNFGSRNNNNNNNNNNNKRKPFKRPS